MDLKLVREEAIERTTRFFWDTRGFVPEQDSEEWEAEYRRQFEQAKARHANGTHAARAAAAPVAAPGPPDQSRWAALTGEPTQTRWAAALRADRLREIRDPGIREWLTTTWTKAKSWIDTQELSTPVFLQRIAPHYRDYRQKADEAARIKAQQLQAQEMAAAALRRQLENSGITAEGLIELIDVCERLPPVPLKTKLGELDLEGRNLRIFETDDPALLMVLEREGKTARSEYAIERDAGLVADLGLFMQAAALS